jgi:hypothetical protein
MNIWWLALDLKFTSYEELKHRKVIATGWPQIGDLRTLCPLAKNPANASLFTDVIRELACIAYGNTDRNIERAQKAIWPLLQVRKNDLVVGIEGTTVRGICRADKDAPDSYYYDASGFYDYAQTICAPVDWKEWNSALLGDPPTTPAQSVLGIKRLQNERERVIEAWSRLSADR